LHSCSCSCSFFLDGTFRVFFEVALSSESRIKLIKWCFITDFTPKLSTFLQFLATTNDTNHWTVFSYRRPRSLNLRESPTFHPKNKKHVTFSLTYFFCFRNRNFEQNNMKLKLWIFSKWWIVVLGCWFGILGSPNEKDYYLGGYHDQILNQKYNH